MDANAWFPVSYDESRQRFRDSLPGLQARWPRARLEQHVLQEHPDVSIDWLWAEPGQRQNLVLISTAEHGIEGYVGAAVMKIFIEELAPRLDPETTGLLLVHAINPWGMKHRCRVNSHNVDLNRNFALDGSYDPAVNPGYDRMRSLLAPGRPVGWLPREDLGFIARVLRGLISPGVAAVREAALLGQHRHPQGLYYGGTQRQEETGVLLGLYRQALENYASVVQVDVHTGYGPRYQMTVLLPCNDPTPSAEARARFAYPLVQKVDASEFYAISGDMCECFVHLRDTEFPGRSLLAGGFEFGTFGDSLPALIRSLRIAILQNQLRQHGARSEAAARAIRAEFGELFFPTELRWREKALQDGRQALQGILRAYGLI
jgi:hypothetical protein